ncbi:MAG: PfkB family carbohydrate kinase [Planctomycetaceae bacterium]
MIVSAGLTPAWQQILQFDALAFGTVNRAAESHWCASGKVLNVGLALHALQVESCTLACVGGAAGQAIRRQFSALRCRADWIETHEDTRVCTTLLRGPTSPVTELVQNAKPIHDKELNAFYERYNTVAADAHLVVLSGSLPPTVPQTFYRNLLRMCRVPAILDARGPELLAALEARPLVVKPNRDELESTIGRNLDRDGVLIDAMRELNRRGASWVVVTDGAEVVWATNSDDVFQFNPLEVAAVNPIGCGDCLAAGLAAGLIAGYDMPQAICCGMAAAADNVGKVLPAELDRDAVFAAVSDVAWSSGS